MSRICLAGVRICAVLGLLATLPAQTPTGQITGSVTDTTGAAVPTAQIVVANVATGVEVSTLANDVGIYSVPFLPPGAYRVTARKEGFKTVNRTGVTLAVDQVARVDVVLEVGAIAESVDVVAQAPAVDSETASLGTVVDNRQIVNIPLNTRNPFRLALLAPGMVPSRSFGDTFNASAKFMINGGRSHSNEIMIDGVTNSLPAAQQFNVNAVFPSPDALQEFKVQTNSFSAEYGRTGGGVVNMVMKSGSNQLHGSAYEFLRNSRMDANNFFANRAGNPLGSFKRSQFGFTAGGPIRRDKAFFFGNYEGLRARGAANATYTFPTGLERQGDYSSSFQRVGTACTAVTVFDPVTTRRNPSGAGFIRDQFPGNRVPASRFDKVGANFVKYYPLPNAPGDSCTQANNFFSSMANPLNSDQMDAKLDLAATAKDRGFAGLSWRRQMTYGPNYYGTIANPTYGTNGDSIPAKALRLDYTRVQTPSLVLNLRFGVSRMERETPPHATPADFKITDLGFPQLLQDQMRKPVTFPYTTVAGYGVLGNSCCAYVFLSFTTYSWNASATHVRGKHTIKFGVDARVNQVYEDTGFATHGNFAFGRGFTQGPDPNVARADRGNGVASLLLGTGSGSVQIIPGTLTSNNYYALYVQDDIKLTRRLTLNLGLRYDLENGRDERFNQLSWFDFDAASPLAGRVPGFQNLRGGLRFLGVDGDRQFDLDRNNFGPRFGLAYSLNSKTVVRTGYGVFYLPYLGAATGGAAGTNGFLENTPWVGSLDGLTPLNYFANPFPTGLVQPQGSRLGLLSGVGRELGGARDGALDRGARVGYAQQWNFNIQRELPGRLSLEAAYTGSKGTKLPDEGWQLNQLTAQQLALGTALQDLVPNPFAGFITEGPLAEARVTRAQLLRPYPQFLGVKNFKPAAASSIYHAFQMRAQKQFSRGLTLLVSYTNGKVIDDSPGTQGQAAAILTSHQDSYNRRASRSVSAEDVSQRMVISYVWDLPFGRGRALGGDWPVWLSMVAGNWQANGITTFSTGTPLEITAPNTSRSFSDVQRPNVSGSPKLAGGRTTDQKLAQWFDTSVFGQPAPFTFGNTARTLPNVRTDGIRNFDFSLFKVFPFRETRKVEFRAEFFNLFNTPQFGLPGRSFGAGGFGVVAGQANDPRQVQLGLRLVF